MNPARPLIGWRTAGAATATFSLVRVTISMILRSLGVVPGSATASVQAAAPVLVVLHRVWFVCQDRQGRPGQQAGELSESRVWQAVSLLCPVSSLHTPHSLLPFKQTVQTSVVPQPHPGPGQCCLLYSAVSATASSLLALVQSRSFQTFEVYVMNVILRGSGIPYSIHIKLFVLEEHNCLVPGLSD